MFNLKKIEYGRLAEFRVYDKPVITGRAPVSTGVRGQGSERALEESLRRTRQSIRDIALSNDWDWFLTWTFDPQKVDSFSYDACVDKLSVWLSNSRRRARNLAYLVVPELHKSGRWHFHGLVSNADALGLKDSGKRDKKGRPIYNVGSYRWGWTTATRIDDSLSAGGYILKYISKDLCAVTLNRRRYWASRNLRRPVVTDIMVVRDELLQLKEVLKENASWTTEAKLEKDGYTNTINYYHLTVYHSMSS